MVESSQPTSLPIVVIACQVFEDLLGRSLPEEMKSDITFLKYGLHRVPKKLTKAVQEAIDRIEQPSLVLLGYGLCGNGLHTIKAGKHTLLIPRADDCIAILLGSYAAYRKEFDSTPGTYYLSKGWLESGSNPLSEYEEYVERLGPEKAMWVMDQQYQHYKRLVFVAHTQDDLEKYRPKALEVAQFCSRWGMQYEELLGSNAYVRQLIELACSQVGANEEFVVIPPGGVLQQNDFIR
jgi:hypothetical protein